MAGTTLVSNWVVYPYGTRLEHQPLTGLAPDVRMRLSARDRRSRIIGSTINRGSGERW